MLDFFKKADNIHKSRNIRKGMLLNTAGLWNLKQ